MKNRNAFTLSQTLIILTCLLIVGIILHNHAIDGPLGQQGMPHRVQRQAHKIALLAAQIALEVKLPVRARLQGPIAKAQDRAFQNFPQAPGLPHAKAASPLVIHDILALR